MKISLGGQNAGAPRENAPLFSVFVVSMRLRDFGEGAKSQDASAWTSLARADDRGVTVFRRVTHQEVLRKKPGIFERTCRQRTASVALPV
ncbi:hypothetical protein AB4037_28970 [Labrys sp. KB_33_2]|uniref:hypothetical protein n=1 Tax=Labrys sp. KB_33_2 TaxID=3237479 RepID=UPI003F92482B